VKQAASGATAVDIERYIPEDRTVDNHRCQYLKYCKIGSFALLKPKFEDVDMYNSQIFI
jgi:hypothetical protein